MNKNKARRGKSVNNKSKDIYRASISSINDINSDLDKKTKRSAKSTNQYNRKSTNRKSKNKTIDKYQKRRICAISAVALIVLIIITIIISVTSRHKIPEEVSLMINNEMITVDNPMYMDDNVAYISKEDIIKLFDKTLYYNEAEKDLITTYNTHIARFTENEKKMILNDSTISIKGCMQSKNGIEYLPLTDMQIIYDVELEYSKDYNRVILDSTKLEKKRSITLKKTKLKQKPSKFSKTIEKVPMSEYVYVLEDCKGYKKVRTSNGNIGYMKTRRISDEETLRTTMVEENVDYKITYNGGEQKIYNIEDLPNDKQNVLVSNYFVLENNQQVADNTSDYDGFDDFMDWASSNNIQIWAGITSNSTVSTNLRTYAQRNEAIKSIYNYLMEHRFQGLAVNFDKIDDFNSFNRFLIEAKPKLKESGFKLAVKINGTIDETEKQKIMEIADMCF